MIDETEITRLPLGEAATSPTEEATEAGETVHEAFMRAIAGNPRFQPARPSGGRAFIIGGAKAAAQKRDDGQA